MSRLSVGKAGAMRHNTGNVSDNKKKDIEAGHKNSRH